MSMIQVYNTKYEKFDFETLCDIHKTIFGEIYPWAGKPRTIQIFKEEDILRGKSIQYSHPFYFERELGNLMSLLKDIKRKNYPLDKFISRLAEVISGIWKVHPFREGNTRTTIAFCVLFVRSMGYVVDSEVFKKQSVFVRHALVKCNDEDDSHFEDFEYILGKAIKLPNSEKCILDNCPQDRYSNVDSTYKTIGGKDISKYKVRPHKYVDKE